MPLGQKIAWTLVRAALWINCIYSYPLCLFAQSDQKIVNTEVFQSVARGILRDLRSQFPGEGYSWHGDFLDYGKYEEMLSEIRIERSPTRLQVHEIRRVNGQLIEDIASRDTQNFCPQESQKYRFSKPIKIYTEMWDSAYRGYLESWEGQVRFEKLVYHEIVQCMFHGKSGNSNPDFGYAHQDLIDHLRDNLRSIWFLRNGFYEPETLGDPLFEAFSLPGLFFVHTDFTNSRFLLYSYPHPESDTFCVSCFSKKAQEFRPPSGIQSWLGNIESAEYRVEALSIPEELRAQVESFTFKMTPTSATRFTYEIKIKYKKEALMQDPSLKPEVTLLTSFRKVALKFPPALSRLKYMKYTDIRFGKKDESGTCNALDKELKDMHQKQNYQIFDQMRLIPAISEFSANSAEFHSDMDALFYPGLLNLPWRNNVDTKSCVAFQKVASDKAQSEIETIDLKPLTQSEHECLRQFVYMRQLPVNFRCSRSMQRAYQHFEFFFIQLKQFESKESYE